jgi:hypothetical protein
MAREQRRVRPDSDTPSAAPPFAEVPVPREWSWSSTVENMSRHIDLEDLDTSTTEQALLGPASEG